jgi:dihydrofolate reductase
MGRKTWDSLPARFRPLPGRRNIVLTRQTDWQAPGAEPVPTLDAAIAQLEGVPRACVIGGAELYAAALPRADELALTEIDCLPDGDVHFPPFDREVFVETAREPHRASPPADFDYAFVTYRRRA